MICGCETPERVCSVRFNQWTRNSPRQQNQKVLLILVFSRFRRNFSPKAPATYRLDYELEHWQEAQRLWLTLGQIQLFEELGLHSVLQVSKVKPQCHSLSTIDLIKSSNNMTSLYLYKVRKVPIWVGNPKFPWITLQPLALGIQRISSSPRSRTCPKSSTSHRALRPPCHRLRICRIATRPRLSSPTLGIPSACCYRWILSCISFWIN